VYAIVRVQNMLHSTFVQHPLAYCRSVSVSDGSGNRG
jgi:hypothetical protein